MTKPGEKMSLDNLMALIGATLPNAYLVAEGVQSAEHAAELQRHHKNIHYMQGMHLPPREQFSPPIRGYKGRSHSLNYRS